MKLRMLNGSHSTLAYLGFLMRSRDDRAGRERSRARGVRRSDRCADEIAPTLVAPPGVRIADYGAELMRRFRNPALPHRTKQIAMDGSQKLPQRLLGTIRDNLAAGRPIDRLALSVAGWMRYVYGRDEHGATIDVADPLAARFATLADAHRDDRRAFARGLLAIDAIFGDDLPREPRVHDSRRSQRSQSLFANGRARTVAAMQWRRGPTLSTPHEAHRSPSGPAVPGRSRRPATSRARSTRRSSTCRSCRRTGTPIRSGSPTTRRSRTRARCSSRRITMCSACSTARACGSRTSAFRAGRTRRGCAPVETDARKIWRTFAAHYHLFRGTPTRIWLDHAFRDDLRHGRAAHARRTPIAISTASTQRSPRRRSVRARCSSASTSR